MHDQEYSNDVVSLVLKKIEKEGISESEAARQIRVSLPSLRKHLAGGYVRSDSVAKYRLWLDGHSNEPTAGPMTESLFGAKPDESLAKHNVTTNLAIPDKPFLAVDLFSGCGGLALGYDLFGEGEWYETAMALDNEEPMVRVFNANSSTENGAPRARQVDLVDFINEAEILTFYLLHVAKLKSDSGLAAEVNSASKERLSRGLSAIRKLDERFAAQLNSVRDTDHYKTSFGHLDSHAMGQTSVVGFHSQLKLPRTGRSGIPKLTRLIWDTDSPDVSCSSEHSAQEGKAANKFREYFCNQWDGQLEILAERANKQATGQLTSASSRINSFLTFIQSAAGQNIRDVWIEWSSSRYAIRQEIFDDQKFERRIRAIYDSSYPVSVLLGGPPCQGFSRIGRGKIRSLQKQGVHVHENGGAGDNRNELLYKYILFVSALRPKVFLFENVRHFKSAVKTPQGTFHAPQLLEESIRDLATDGLSYHVASRIIDASKHLVPQKRERFFMAGIKEDLRQIDRSIDMAEWLLELPDEESVVLSDALHGLPAPVLFERKEPGENPVAQTVDVPLRRKPVANDAGSYKNWIRRPAPYKQVGSATNVDGHCARKTRIDDAAFFQLVGPGRRWMDYRCDESESLAMLREVVGWAITQKNKSDRSESEAGPSTATIQKVYDALDGSFSIRLLLESIDSLPGEQRHHLLTPGYLSKKDGNHGDWLQRMDPTRPSKTITSHMAKDTYAYVHPYDARTLSVREAARIQSFPDWFQFGSVGLVDAFRIVGNAVPPLLSHQIASRVAQILSAEMDISKSSSSNERKAMIA